MQELEKFIDYSIELLEDEKLDKGLNEERESLLEQLKDLQVKLNLPVVGVTLPSKNSEDFKVWLVDNGYAKITHTTLYIKGDLTYEIDTLYKHFTNVIEYGN